ncbi:hypothetical protein ACFL3D_00355 [Candidatus Omnitrophota bacterium]
MESNLNTKITCPLCKQTFEVDGDMQGKHIHYCPLCDGKLSIQEDTVLPYDEFMNNNDYVDDSD